MAEFRGWGGAALITGGSGGIGLALAREFARRGIDLVLVARSRENLRINAEKLAKAHGIRVEWREADLASLDGPAELVKALGEIDMTIDILVNNAAFGVHGGYLAQGPEREAEMTRLNVSAPVELTGRMLPGMMRRKRGLVLNVGSTAGFAPVPWLATYAATKAFLLSWTEALAQELKESGVRFSILCPGSTATNFHAVSGADKEGGRTGVFGEQTAEQVAEECMRGLDARKTVIVTGGFNKVHSTLASSLPRGVSAAMAYRVMRPKT
ncbi:MAG: SDR family oxidoreductase, partial [Gemmatimonadetes bacterium]|nr:SDR family oxidoreductase [Gemmatimonadota bacterium]